MAAEVQTKQPRATRAVLRRRDFRLLLTAFAVSRAGDFLYIVALVVYVYDKTGSPAWVSAATLLRLLPYAVLSPVAGVVVDRFERRTVMLASNLVQLALMAALTVAAALSAPAAVVIALSFLGTVAATVTPPAMSATTQSVVPEDELAAANSLVGAVDAVAYIAGPAAGAVLLFLGAPAIAFGVDAVTFLVAAACLAAVRARSHPGSAGERRGAVAELRQGMGVLAHDRTVAVLVGCIVAATVVYGAELVLHVLVSSELLGTGSAGLGLLSAALGAGGLVGAMLGSRLGSTARPRLTLTVLVLMAGVPLAGLSMVDEPLVAYILLFLEGVAVSALDVLVETTLQRNVAGDVLGRVAGLVMSLAVTGMLAGALLAPILVDVLALRPALALIGLLPVALAAAAVLAFLPGLDTRTERAYERLAPRLQVLRELRLLEGADPATLERLAAAATEERAPAGSVVLRQGDPADDLFILRSGRLAVEHTADGVTRRVAEMSAPDYFGEIGLLQGSPRTATVSATEDSVVWRLPGPLFLDAVAARPALSPALAMGMSTRLARTVAR